MRAFLVALSMAAVVLAGCSEADQPGAPSEPTQDLGCISGLVVDDRFRPLHLTDSPQSEFQARGFVLVVETGDELQTNENGEFEVCGLEPGTYTLRASIEGHDAAPAKAQVIAGFFAEQDILARRVSNSEDVLITEQYAAFVPCMVNTPPAALQCSLVFPPDTSGETGRENFETDYRKIPAQWVVIELYSNQDASSDGALKIVARNASNGDNYVVNDVITEGDYMKVWLHNGSISPHDVELRNQRWTNEDAQTVQLWAQGLLKQETTPVVEALCLVPICAGDTAESRGLGVRLGVQANFVISIYLWDEDEAAIESYCTLCQ